MDLIDFDSFIIYGEPGTGKSTTGLGLIVSLAILGRKYELQDDNLTDTTRHFHLLNPQGVKYSHPSLGVVRILTTDNTKEVISKPLSKKEFRISCGVYGLGFECTYINAQDKQVSFYVPFYDIQHIHQFFNVSKETNTLHEKYIDEDRRTKRNESL